MKRYLLRGLTTSVMIFSLNLHVKAVTATEALSDADIHEGLMAVEAYIYIKPPSSDKVKLYDPVRNKKVLLKLHTIHQGGFRNMGNGNAAICAEFKSEENKNYMLWFVVGKKETPDQHFYGGYVQDVEVDRTIVKEVYIHKVDGIERYAWNEQDGISRISPVPQKGHHH